MSDSTLPLTPGQPGTVTAIKAGAKYRNAPHTLRADTGPDGTVTLTVQQNYTGKRQWFRFDEDQWGQLFNAGDHPDMTLILYRLDQAEQRLISKHPKAAADPELAAMLRSLRDEATALNGDARDQEQENQ